MFMIKSAFGKVSESNEFRFENSLKSPLNDATFSDTFLKTVL